MATTKMQRQVSPLPAGRYWVAVSREKEPDFLAWVADMQGGARIISSQGRGGSVFVLFEVPQGRSPFFNVAAFGYPNFAPAGPPDQVMTAIVDSADLPLDATDQLSNLTDNFLSGGAAKMILAALLIGLLLGRR